MTALLARAWPGPWPGPQLPSRLTAGGGDGEPDGTLLQGTSGVPPGLRPFGRAWRASESPSDMSSAVDSASSSDDSPLDLSACSVASAGAPAMACCLAVPHGTAASACEPPCSARQRHRLRAWPLRTRWPVHTTISPRVPSRLLSPAVADYSPACVAGTLASFLHCAAAAHSAGAVVVSLAAAVSQRLGRLWVPSGFRRLLITSGLQWCLMRHSPAKKKLDSMDLHGSQRP